MKAESIFNNIKKKIEQFDIASLKKYYSIKEEREVIKFIQFQDWRLGSLNIINLKNFEIELNVVG